MAATLYDSEFGILQLCWDRMLVFAPCRASASPGTLAGAISLVARKNPQQLQRVADVLAVVSGQVGISGWRRRSSSAIATVRSNWTSACFTPSTYIKESCL